MPNGNVDLSEFRELSGSALRECKVARLTKSLSRADQANLAAALAAERKTISDLAIVKWFRARDLKIGDQTIGLHRTGACCCG